VVTEAMVASEQLGGMGQTPRWETLWARRLRMVEMAALVETQALEARAATPPLLWWRRRRR
jgi:hypothetical protein